MERIDRMRDNIFKFREDQFRLNIWKMSSAMKVVKKYWSRFSREVVHDSFLELFKLRFNGAEKLDVV